MSFRRITEAKGSASRRAEALRFVLIGTVAAGCTFDSGERWMFGTATAPSAVCTPGEHRCGGGLQECVVGNDGPEWKVVDDCPGKGLVCAPALERCAECIPDDKRCNGQDVERCSPDGREFVFEQTCDSSSNISCRDGVCSDLCALAAERRSNVGCEYWAVDLDNADVDDTLNAAKQQFAVVVSNPESDVSATVTIELDDSALGDANAPRQIASAKVLPLSLHVFKLGPREVDGSPPGEYNTGTSTAVTRHAYRVKSSIPVVVVQFNPLDNVNVFSNDASLLKPVEALPRPTDTVETQYVVLGWPQTIAVTDDPNTNFSTTNPLNLRAFLTVVGTRPDTHVHLTTQAHVLGGGPIADTPVGGAIDYTLQPFDVLNLETLDFNADFTGSIVDADQPVVVFSGSEASDAPFFKTLADRQCCADHLEEQLDPVRTAGKRFIATVTPNRTKALIQAGAATLAEFDAPEYFRVAAATTSGAHIKTTLTKPFDHIDLDTLGSFAHITAKSDFTLESDQPVSLASISPSQAASGVPRGLPGGDPSLLVIPPIEQFRQTYVFLTPDKYSFDFIRVVAPKDAIVQLDGDRIDRLATCEHDDVPGLDKSDSGFVAYRCQLGFPVIDLSGNAATLLSPGLQNDGVHEIVSSRKVGVLVDGFDRNVSYAYAAGTELTEIVIPH
jgi:hypothetical protein